jgi:hypothetical protein
MAEVSFQACDGVIGDERGDSFRALVSIRSEPLSGPVESAQKRARGDRWISSLQFTTPDSVRDKRTDPMLVPVTFGKNRRAQPGRQRLDFQVGGGTFDFVDEAEHMGGGEAMKPCVNSAVRRPGSCERAQQAVERPILTEEEELLLATEVVIQVARREVGGDGNLAHARGRESSEAEDAGCRPQDADASRICSSGDPDRTAVRQLNHGSIVRPKVVAGQG